MKLIFTDIDGILNSALGNGPYESDMEADKLVLLKKLKGFMFHINVIPLNPVKERTLRGTTRLFAYKFVDKLKEKGLSATVRRTMGEDIEGACGQLRNKILSERK